MKITAGKRISKNVTVCLFDVDGTLIDSPRHGVVSGKEVARKLGLRVPADEEIIQVLTLATGFEQYLRAIWPGEVTMEDYDRAYHECGFHQVPIPVFPGTREALGKIREKCFLGIISNRDRTSLERRLEQSRISIDWFAVIQSIEEPNCIYKPDPEVFTQPCCKIYAHGYSPEEAVLVGDTIVDYQTTIDTPIDFVGVLSGLTSKEMFLEAGVPEEHILNSVADLPNFLGI